MDASTRLFSFVVELVYLPVQIEDRKIREIFDKISENHSISAFMTLPDGSIQMSSKEEKHNLTKYRVMKERVVLSYDFCANSLNYYQGLVSDFMEIFRNSTGIPMCLMHSVVIRKLINFKGVEDSRDYLIKSVFSWKEENLMKFGRPLHMAGARVFFPPIPGDQTTYDIKFESSIDDYRTLFVESASIFSTPIDFQNQGMSALGNDINKADEFLNRNILGFLGQFGEKG
jgi:hypothetical protein